MHKYNQPQRGGRNGLPQVLSPLPGLGPFLNAHPQLPLWATFYRHSVAAERAVSSTSTPLHELQRKTGSERGLTPHGKRDVIAVRLVGPGGPALAAVVGEVGADAVNGETLR